MINKTATINITDRCNLNCPCCIWMLENANTDDMSMEEFKNIIDYLKCDNYSEVLLQSEGEPLVHKQYRSMIKYIISNGMKMDRLVTNGLLLDEIIDLLPDIRLTVSMDGYFPGIQEDHRNRNSDQLNKIVNNIKLAVSTPNRKSICINNVVTSDNYRNIINVIKFYEGLGVDLIRFHRYNPKVNDSKVLHFNDEIFKFFVDNLIDRNNFKSRIKIILPATRDVVFDCQKLNDGGVTVGLNGNLSPCCHIHTNKKYGVYNNQSECLLEFKNKFNNAKKEGDLPSECKKCPRLNTMVVVFDPYSKKWYKGT